MPKNVYIINQINLDKSRLLDKGKKLGKLTVNIQIEAQGYLKPMGFNLNQKYRNGGFFAHTSHVLIFFFL